MALPHHYEGNACEPDSRFNFSNVSVYTLHPSLFKLIAGLGKCKAASYDPPAPIEELPKTPLLSLDSMLKKYQLCIAGVFEGNPLNFIHSLKKEFAFTGVC